MADSKTYRARAREQLGGNIFSNNWLIALVICLIASAILAVVSFTYVGTLILMGPVYIALAFVFADLARNGGSLKIETLFKNVSARFGEKILLGLIIGIFTFLWSLLLVIPGIIKYYSYSMAYYIFNDHPEYDWGTCIKKSMELTKGHKMQLFLLDLSFIGWIIVGALAFGVGTLWVSPYMYAARANFYLDLVAQPEVQQA